LVVDVPLSSPLTQMFTFEIGLFKYVTFPVIVLSSGVVSCAIAETEKQIKKVNA
jgi:hypothetical protein